MDADVLIVGASIAGSSAARRLAASGHRVLLVDKARFPRDKACGEGLMPAGVKRLQDAGDDDVLEAIDAQPFAGIRYRSGDLSAVGNFEDGASGRGVRRQFLDDKLLKKATALDNVSFLRAAAKTVSQDDTGVTVALSDGKKIRGKMLIGADGQRSLIRHQLGLDRLLNGPGRYALRQHFEIPQELMPTHVEVDVFDDFETYITPVGPTTIGIAALCEKTAIKRHSGDKQSKLAALLGDAHAETRERLATGKPASAALACGPLRVRPKGLFSGRCVLLGDAAGYVDALSGEGMSLALKQAEVLCPLVDAVLRDEVAPAKAFSQYSRARRAMVRDHVVLTLTMLNVVRRPRMVRRLISRLQREPALFSRVLSVNDGARTLAGLGPRDLAALAVGSAPPRAA